METASSRDLSARSHLTRFEVSSIQALLVRTFAVPVAGTVPAGSERRRFSRRPLIYDLYVHIRVYIDMCVCVGMICAYTYLCVNAFIHEGDMSK